MNKLAFYLLTFSFLLHSCKEKIVEIPTPKGPTIVKGRVTLLNTDIPVPDIDIYLWNGGFPSGMKLVTETVSDSLGYYELTFTDPDTYAKLSTNFSHTPYLGTRQKGGIEQNQVIDNDGKTHIWDLEMVPPAWVNVRLLKKDLFPDHYDKVGVNSKHFAGGGFNKYGPSDSTFLVKVWGNYNDTISFHYMEMNSIDLSINSLKEMKFPINVPAFQVGDLTIEY